MRRPLWTPRWGRALRKQTEQPIQASAHLLLAVLGTAAWCASHDPDSPVSGQRARVVARGQPAAVAPRPPAQHPKVKLQPRGARVSPSAFLENSACSKMTQLSKIRPRAGRRCPVVGCRGQGSLASAFSGWFGKQSVQSLSTDCGRAVRAKHGVPVPEAMADSGVGGRAWHGCPTSRTLWSLCVFPVAV